MTGPRLDEWLLAVGFEPIEGPVAAIDDADDPWGSTDVPATPLSDEQRAFLAGAVDDGPLDPELLADAEATVIDIPADPDDVEPF